MMQRRLTWLILVLGVVFLTKIGLANLRGMPVDFRSFYVAGQGVVKQGNIYDSQYLNQLAGEAGLPGSVFPYLYPPVLATYLAPLAPLGAKTASHLWSLLSIVLCIAVVGLGLYLAYRQVQWTNDADLLGPFLFGFVLFYMLPFDNNLMMGQVNILVLTCIIAALVRALVHDHDLSAGFLLAPAALIKITPIFLLLFFLLERRWKAVYGFLAGLVVFALPTLLSAGGLQLWLDFFDFAATLSYGKTIPGLASFGAVPNFSLAGALTRLIADPAVVNVLAWVLLLFLAALLVIQHRRLAGARARVFLLLPYLVLMIIASPLTFFHHIIYIYPGILVISWILLHRAKREAILLLLLLLGTALIASIDFPIYYEALSIEAELLRSLNLYALLVLFGLGLLLPELRVVQGLENADPAAPS